jgi:hypothetical protein
LKAIKVAEHGEAKFECDVNDKDAEVWFFHKNEKIIPDGKRVKVEVQNRKRRLIIKDVELDDEGEYKGKTKDDETLGALFVEAANRFLVKIKDTTAIERNTVEFRCETKVSGSGIVRINRR